MSMPEEYRNSFVAQLHNALSGFTGTDVDEAVRYGIFQRSPAHKSLTNIGRYSEQSKSKAIGITIETRPDYCLRPHLRFVSTFCGYPRRPNDTIARCYGTVVQD